MHKSGSWPLADSTMYHRVWLVSPIMSDRDAAPSMSGAYEFAWREWKEGWQGKRDMVRVARRFDGEILIEIAAFIFLDLRGDMEYVSQRIEWQLCRRIKFSIGWFEWKSLVPFSLNESSILGIVAKKWSRGFLQLLLTVGTKQWDIETRYSLYNNTSILVCNTQTNCPSFELC